MDDPLIRIIIFFPVFLFALTIHEVAHALTANWGGDLTSTNQNRLSLNPLVHSDLFGTWLFPLILLFHGGFVFGWAKPVPVDLRNLRKPAWNVVVSMAGPFSNLLLAIFGALIFALSMRVMYVGMEAGWWILGSDFLLIYTRFWVMFVFLNLLLLFFNLLPVPPLDGSHVLYHYLVKGRGKLYEYWDFYSRFGFLLLIILLFFTNFGQIFGGVLWRVSYVLLGLVDAPSPAQFDLLRNSISTNG